VRDEGTHQIAMVRLHDYTPAGWDCPSQSSEDGYVFLFRSVSKRGEDIAGDIVDPSDSVLPDNDGNGGTANYATHLKLLRGAGYDAVAVGNHDCCGANGASGNIGPFGFDWSDYQKLTATVAEAQQVGLHVLSANLHELGQEQCDFAKSDYAMCLQNQQTWRVYEQQLEDFVAFPRNGLQVGVFGLTAPATYGGRIKTNSPNGPIYQPAKIYTDPVGTLLTEGQMREVAGKLAQSPPSGVNILVALTHILIDLTSPVSQYPIPHREPASVYWREGVNETTLTHGRHACFCWLASELEIGKDRSVSGQTELKHAKEEE
jgi:hypothetical protein